MDRKKKINTIQYIFAILITMALSAPAWAILTVDQSDCAGSEYCTIQGAITDAIAVGAEEIHVYATAQPYMEAITITKCATCTKITLLGKKAGEVDAWTVGKKGSSSDAPIISITNTAFNNPLIILGDDAIEMKGFHIYTVGGSPISATAISGNIGYVTMSYCSFEIDEGENAIAVDYGHSVSNLSVTYCTFTGQVSTTNWFYVGSGTSAAGDGGAANNVTLLLNEITNTTSRLQIDNDIKNIQYLTNTFNNNMDAGSYGDGAGYIFIEKPDNAVSGKIQGITISYNIFNNSENGVTNEYAIAIAQNVTETHAAGNWNANLAINYNKFLQDDDDDAYPIVGFKNAAAVSISPTYYINAENNWWGNEAGPRSFESETGPTPAADVSNKVDYSPWIAEDFTIGTIPSSWGTSDSIQELIEASTVDDGDTIYIVDKGSAYAEAITITKQLTLIGRESDGDDAWTDGTAGANSGTAPTISAPCDPLIIFANDNIGMKGFQITAPVATSISCTAFSGSRKNITLTYCSFSLDDGDKGIAVDYGHSIDYLTATYCNFSGQADNISNWFFVGDEGSGGSVNHVMLSNNTISNAMSTLQLNNTIKNIQYSNNIFRNTWDINLLPPTTYYGYILIDEPDDNVTNIIRGVTLTHNLFMNSTGSAPHEFAILITKDVEEDDAENWENLAFHFNNFLQGDDDSGVYPIVGFEKDSLAHTSAITATNNWWNSTSGPRIFEKESGVSTTPDVSDYVDYNPWIHADVPPGWWAIEGGIYATIGASPTTQITDTLHDMAFEINTTGTATLIPTKYTANPITETSGLTNGSSFFDLGIKSGLSNINWITATFNYPTDTDITESSKPAYFFNGSSWKQCSSQAVTQTSRAVSVYITPTFSTPNMVSLTTINSTTQTFFALEYSISISTSTTTSTPSTTTTTDDDSNGTTTTVTPTSTTTTSTGGKTTSTTTTSTPPTTTTTVGVPELKVSPVPLDFEDNETAKTLTISNTGAGTLEWIINYDNETHYDNETDNESDLNWIFSVIPNTGSVATADSVTVTVSRKGLTTGSYSADLPIASNGGDFDLDVNMEVEKREFPILNIIPRVILFLNDDVTEKSFRITNLFRNGALTWEILTPDYKGKGEEGWITSISPSSGFTTKKSDTIQVTVNRDGLGLGIYRAVIPVRSNAGRNRNVTVIMLVQEGPLLRVKPFMRIYLKDETEKTFTITNSKSGTLTWKVGDPVYKGNGEQDWITSIIPSSGSTTTKEDEFTVTVSTVGLDPGIYRAKIPVTSNGGDRNVTVFLLVPFF